MKTTFKLEVIDHYECISSLSNLTRREVLEHLYFLLNDLYRETIVINLDCEVDE